MTDRPVESRDEIELVEILRVIWKWKYLILVGTLVFALIAVVINLKKPEIYRINMLIQPGILEVTRAGKVIYVDSPENIKAVIEAGSFNGEILKYLRSSHKRNIPRFLEFEVKIPRKSDVLQITYESNQKELGIAIMEHLADQISLTYNDQIKNSRNAKDAEIQAREATLAILEGEISFLKESSKSTQDRIVDLKNYIDIMKENNSRLINDKDRENDLLDSFYNNIIQQNTTFISLYNNEIYNYLNMIRNDRERITRLLTEIDRLSGNIRDLKYEKDQIKGIEVLQAPAHRVRLVKPKIRLNIILALVVGVVVMFFLAFFIEYILKYRARELE
jgi:uncharacterized protein involved in exopolysaccharide biosynthesis